MRDQIAGAMKARFARTIEETSELTFKESGVTMPRDEVWHSYADAALGALEMPTYGMRRVMAEVGIPPSLHNAFMSKLVQAAKGD